MLLGPVEAEQPLVRPSATSRPAGSNHGSAIRSARLAASIAPCSGWCGEGRGVDADHVVGVGVAVAADRHAVGHASAGSGREVDRRITHSSRTRSKPVRAPPAARRPGGRRATTRSAAVRRRPAPRPRARRPSPRPRAVGRTARSSVAVVQRARSRRRPRHERAAGQPVVRARSWAASSSGSAPSAAAASRRRDVPSIGTAACAVDPRRPVARRSAADPSRRSASTAGVLARLRARRARRPRGGAPWPGPAGRRSGSRRCGRCRSASRARGRAWRAAGARGRRRCGCRRSSRSPRPPGAAAARLKTRPGCWARNFSSSNSLKVRSRRPPADLGGVRRVVDDDLAGADHVGLGVVGLALRRQPADGEPDPGLELGRAAGVEHDVVHAPVVGDDGEAALGDDEQDGHVGAGGADQPAQVAGVRRGPGARRRGRGRRRGRRAARCPRRAGS